MPILSDGQEIKGTYEIERFLGEGAFAEVYRVKHRFLGRQAMKVFKRTGMTQVEIETMLGEAILLSKIGHPNIVRVFDANVLEANSEIHGYFTMENVSGGSLDRFWQSHGSGLVPLKTTVDIICQVCRGLGVAHAEEPPIIHRDIKPQNILVGYEADGLRARISDFGLAKRVNPLTLLATAAGTLSFKPPEAFLKGKNDSCAGDIWGMGATLYLLLTDSLPVKLDAELGWNNRKAFDKEIVRPSEYNVYVDKKLEKIVLRCLEKNPKDRHQNAKELLHALEGWEPQPRKKSRIAKSSSGDISKSVLGKYGEIDQEEGYELVRMAIKKAKESGRLLEAADMMEEAFNKWPSLRPKYANQVRLWRCGVSM